MSRTRNRYGNSYEAMVEAEWDEYEGDDDEGRDDTGPEDGDDDDPGNWED